MTLLGETWREIVAECLPDFYDARIVERVNLTQLEPDVVKLISPDVALSQGPRTRECDQLAILGDGVS